MDFKTFVNNQALQDKLPFGITFDISPTASGVAETVAGFEFPVYDELLSREAWFFEAIESTNGSKTSELQLSIRALGKKLQTACSLETLAEAINQLFDPTDEIVNTKEYQDFTDVNLQDIDRVVELFRLSQNNQAINWLRVTFFILSRVDAEWTLGKTAALRNSQIDEIISFISKEANGGVLPEAVEAEEVESEGKTGLEETGASSTGK